MRRRCALRLPARMNARFVVPRRFRMNAPSLRVPARLRRSLRLLASRRCLLASFFCAYKERILPMPKPHLSIILSLDPLSLSRTCGRRLRELRHHFIPSPLSPLTMSGSPLRWPSDSDTPSDEDNHPERRRFWERDESPPTLRPRARRSRAGDDSLPPADDSPLPSDDSPPLVVADEDVEARLDELERLEAQDLLHQERAEKRAEDLAQARAKKRAEEVAKRAARVEAKVAAEEAAAKRRRPPSDDDDGAAGTSAKKQKIEMAR